MRKKKLFVGAGILVLMAIIAIIAIHTPNNSETISEDNIPSETEVIEASVIENFDIWENYKGSNEYSDIGPKEENVIEVTQSSKIEEVIEETPSEEEVIISSEEEIVENDEFQEENIVYETSGEYPIAEQCWRYLKDCGFNDYVVAGIIGNFMTEVGGQTLNLSYYAESYAGNGGYYGLCMWSMKYVPQMGGASVAQQLAFLASDIEVQFNYCGASFGYSYSDFCNIQNEQEAALVFAKVYERCGSGSYGVRQSNATEALNYFT